MHNILPSNFFSCTLTDCETIYKFATTKSVKLTNEIEDVADAIAAANYLELQEKTHDAVCRLFGQYALFTGVAFATYFVVPIITCEFCLGVAISIALFVVGRDLFVIAETRNAKKAELQLVTATSMLTYFKQSNSEAIFKNTLMPSFWQFLFANPNN